MKSLIQHIQEKLKISNNTTFYKYFPQTRKELDELLVKLIKERGNNANLNDIDTSEIKDMRCLFSQFDSNNNFSTKLYKFNGDISNWDVSNVETMANMFEDSEFNGDLSKWNVKKVNDMSSMFAGSKLTSENGSLENWDITNVKYMDYMFFGSYYANDLSKWVLNEKCSTHRMFDNNIIDLRPKLQPKNYKK